MSELLTTDQLAERLQVSRRTIEKMKTAGKITPAINETRLVRYDLADVLDELKPKKKAARRP
jgi:excisionase family DNA binding protein